MHQVPGCFKEMLDIHDHIPQAVVLVVAGIDTEAQAIEEEMSTDVAAIWDKVKLDNTQAWPVCIAFAPKTFGVKAFTQ